MWTLNSRSIDEQLQRVYDLLVAADLPHEVEADINKRIDKVVAELARRRDDGAYARYVAGVIAREHSRIRRGERDKPLCACGDPLCPLSSGRLPPQLRPVKTQNFHTRSTKELIDEYEETHPEAFILRESRREWEKGEAGIERELRTIMAELRPYRMNPVDHEISEI